MEQKIKVVMVKPNQQPYEETIENSLESAQKIVGGYIEAVILERHCVLICNEEGKLMNLPPNRLLDFDIIVGNFFITKSDIEGNFTSLSEEDVEYFKNKFAI